MTASSAWYQRPVAEGVCEYDGAFEYPVFIIEQNYDYFYTMAEADGMLDPGELPCLNAEGKIYYLFFGALPSNRPYAVSHLGGGFCSPSAAKEWAAQNLSYFRRWNHQ